MRLSRTALLSFRGTGLLLVGAAAVTGFGVLEAQVTSRWAVQGEPELRIGETFGADEYLFVFPQGARVLSDGRIAVTEGSNRDFWIRYYGADGRFQASAGGFGDGPFEFRQGARIFERLPGDSLFVATSRRRFSVFGPGGEGVRTGRFDQTPDPVLGLADASHLAVLRWRLISGRGVGPGMTVADQQVALVDLNTGATVGDLEAGRSRGLFGDGGLILHLPFEPTPLWAIGGGHVWSASSADRTIQGMSTQGAAVAVTVSWEPRAISRTDEGAWRDRDLGGTTGQRRRAFQQHHRRVRFPDTMPTIGGLEVDSSGNLWVLKYEPPWSDVPLEWEVFAPDGRLLATVSAPLSVVPDLRGESPLGSTAVLDIGADYILVRTRDELGVSRIAKHAVQR